MSLINKSVGEKGVNEPRDVKVVQRLLNKHSLPPLRDLSVDGVAGKNTIDAIKHFQSVVMKVQRPDGRVDPGGKTIRMLNRGTENKPKSETEPSTEPNSPLSQKHKADRKERRDFVLPAVKEIAITTKIINYIQPHFKDIDAKVKSGYLTKSDLFWKVNYHWDFLLNFVKHSQALPISIKHKNNLGAIASQLLSNKPEPATGYVSKNKIGVPADKSSKDKFDRRYKIVKQSKNDFRAVMKAAELKKKSKRRSKDFDLAVAPVLPPGKGATHQYGYAIDIEGNNSQIKSICKKLGATKTFDEGSHVHVEFKDGVPG